MADHNLIEYAKKHLLEHMRRAGFREEEIEEYIMSIPARDPLRLHFVAQFIATQAVELREATMRRLLPTFQARVLSKVSVFTVDGEPSFDVPMYFETDDIANLVTATYGNQKSGLPHSWSRN